jgi:hypothetical protein
MFEEMLRAKVYARADRRGAFEKRTTFALLSSAFRTPDRRPIAAIRRGLRHRTRRSRDRVRSSLAVSMHSHPELARELDRFG